MERAIFGQVIFDDPAFKVVIVQAAVAKQAIDMEIWREFLEAMRGVMGKSGSRRTRLHDLTY